MLASAKHATAQGRQRGLGAKYNASPMQLRLRRAMVSSLDDNLARLFGALAGTKHGRNTVVIFIGDNGAHPVVGGGKATLTDAGVRVPLIIKDPRAKQTGQSVPLLVEAVDIVPTILDYAMIAAAPGTLDGRSLMPLVRGETVNPAAWRTTAFAQLKSGLYLTDGEWFANTTVKSDAEPVNYYRSEAYPNPNPEPVPERNIPAAVQAAFKQAFAEKRAAWWAARDRIFHEHPECVPAETRSAKNLETARLKAGGPPKAKSAQADWHARSMFLLHLDHHTTDKVEVGRDADPVETARLINLVRPDVIQIHAKGNPGWTTYPTKIGHTPPKLACDVMQVWTDIARSHGYTFSAYYNLGRDGEIMHRHPEWNRVQADGTPWDKALCYHSGVAEGYLWPMIDEIMERYRPGGFWFDGSCFTITHCYCARCRERFRREHHLEAPASPKEPGWSDYKEMQRQIYREFCAATAARIKQRDPACLVAINWAYSLRMPEEPPPGVDYFTGDHGAMVDDLAPDAIWYDSQSKSFDLMTTVFYLDRQGPQCKPRLQLEQEMGIIIAHGGRYFAWDNPTAQSGLVAEHFEHLARVVTPFLRARQAWCLGSRSAPDISIFHGAAPHYALNSTRRVAFAPQNPPLLAACEGLRRLHLSPEMISDHRLEQGDIRGRLLLLEDCLALTDANRSALRRYVENGGRILLTGKAVEAAQFGQAATASGPSRQTIGKGEVCCLPQPLFANAAGEKSSFPQAGEYLQRILPSAQRRLITDAPETIELVLREKAGATILHLVNIAPGNREHAPKAPQFLNLRLVELPPAPGCQVSVQLRDRPKSVTLQPQNKPVADWTWQDGRLKLAVPPFETHQMVVIQPLPKQ